jgi:hypothetical protein
MENHLMNDLTRSELQSHPSERARRRYRSVIFAVIVSAGMLAVVSATMPAPVQTDVLTRQYDNARTGANLRETILTPTTIGPRTFGKLFELPVDENVEAQPLLVRNVAVPGHGPMNLVVIATMNNSVYAFDESTGKEIWKSAQLAVPIPSSTAFDYWLTDTRWGILGTPVIDPQTSSLYAVTWGSVGGKHEYRIHVINLKTGADSRSIVIGGSIVYSEAKTGRAMRLSFDPELEKQRPALLLQKYAVGATEHKVLFIAFGATVESVPDKSPSQMNSHGWVFAYDVGELSLPAQTMRPAIWCSTPRVALGGIWQAGNGIAADRRGDVYAMTGNGSFDNSVDLSESIVKLRYTPGHAAGDGDATLQAVDWFTAFEDANRESDPDHQDRDLGSAGPLVAEDLGSVIGGGKDGIIYRARLDRLGHMDWHALPEAPFLATYTAAPHDDPAANYPKHLDVPVPENRWRHIHGTPVYWNPDRVGPMLYVWGENDYLRAYRYLDARFVSTAVGDERASKPMVAPSRPPDWPDSCKPILLRPDRWQTAGCQPGGGMTGGMLTLSANGNDPSSGVVWATAPLTGDANRGCNDPQECANLQVKPGHYDVEGILRAYAAMPQASGPSGKPQLRLLWDSDRNPADRYGYFAKFTFPMVVNGRVYVPTFSNKVVVYGLKPSGGAP